jgi:hypothetical protein
MWLGDGSRVVVGDLVERYKNLSRGSSFEAGQSYKVARITSNGWISVRGKENITSNPKNFRKVTFEKPIEKPVENVIDKIIYELYSTRWTGDLNKSPIEDMRKQLCKTLSNQVDGFWSGHTAYHIAVDGGFLIDSKRVYIGDQNLCKGKTLTMLGEIFMREMRGVK